MGLMGMGFSTVAIAAGAIMYWAVTARGTASGSRPLGSSSWSSALSAWSSRRSFSPRHVVLRAVVGMRTTSRPSMRKVARLRYTKKCADPVHLRRSDRGDSCRRPHLHDVAAQPGISTESARIVRTLWIATGRR
jgi:hypothetical protein